MHPLLGPRRVRPPFNLTIVPDAIAHIDEELADAAVAMMERNMRADVVTPEDCVFAGPG